MGKLAGKVAVYRVECCLLLKDEKSGMYVILKDVLYSFCSFRGFEKVNET